MGNEGRQHKILGNFAHGKKRDQKSRFEIQLSPSGLSLPPALSLRVLLGGDRGTDAQGQLELLSPLLLC